MEAYKVRNADGLFASGPLTCWTKKGRTWSSRQAMNSSFTFWLRRRWKTTPDLPQDWVVVELTETGIREIPAGQFYQEKRGK